MAHHIQVRYKWVDIEQNNEGRAFVEVELMGATAA